MRPHPFRPVVLLALIAGLASLFSAPAMSAPAPYAKPCVADTPPLRLAELPPIRMTLALLELPAPDDSVLIGACGEVVFADPGPDDDPNFFDPPAPEDFDPRALSSNPSASLKIYLDFDGETIRDTLWNSYSQGSPFSLGAFDRDGSPSLSAAEAAAIWAAWSITSGQFAAFDVDVTTIRPAVADLVRDSPLDARWGLHVVITNEEGPVYANGACDCAGIAVLGAVDGYGEQFSRSQPALVFASSSWISVGADIATVVTHELGHNLGLVHDGFFEAEYYGGPIPHGSTRAPDNAWRPIMGAAYRLPAQWSRSDYEGATNDQDDLEVIRRHLGRAVDDVPRAVPLEVDEWKWGVISSADDTDIFDVQLGPGTYNLEVGAHRSGSLVPEILVTDGDDVDRGRGLTEDNAGLGSSGPFRVASVRVTVPPDAAAQSFSLTIDGVPAATTTGSRSDYGSLGAFYVRARPVDLPVLVTPPLPEIVLGEQLPRGFVIAVASGGGAPDNVTVEDGVFPFRWQYTNQEVVPGLFLETSKNSQFPRGDHLRLFGAPEEIGVFEIPIRVRGLNNEEASTTTTLTVRERPVPVETLVLDSPRSLRGVVGQFASLSLVASGGRGPVAWSLVGGSTSLPRGLAFSAVGAQATISGTPRRAGRFVVEVVVTTADGQVVSRTLRVRVRKG